MNIMLQMDDEPPSFWPGQERLTSAAKEIFDTEWDLKSQYLLTAKKAQPTFCVNVACR